MNLIEEILKDSTIKRLKRIYKEILEERNRIYEEDILSHAKRETVDSILKDYEEQLEKIRKKINNLIIDILNKIVLEG